jgi:hypothetical protein
LLTRAHAYLINCAAGIIAGLFVYVIIRLFSYQLFDFQRTWWGYALYKRRADTSNRGMFCPVPGFNVNKGPGGSVLPWEPFYW